MNSRKWVYLFISTLIVGGVSTIITGFFIEWNQYIELIGEAEILELLSVLVWLLGVGFMFSIISQMGFFAYLTIHRFGLGIFRSMWSGVQIVLVTFVLFDLVYFRYVKFAEPGQSIIPYLVPVILLLAYALVISYMKAKQTNQGAFVPALFFMVLVTVLEWFPALRANNSDWLLLMIFPLLASNTWQLMILHKLHAKQ